MKVYLIIVQLMVALIFHTTFASFPEDCVPKNELSGEDEALGQRFVDNIIGINLKFAAQKYMLTRKSEFGKSGTKLKFFNSLKEMSTQHQIYSSILFDGLALVDGGSISFEGYMSSVYVIDPKKGIVLSKLNKCSNHDDGYYQKGKNLYYYCEWHCSKNQVYSLDTEAKKIVKTDGTTFCKGIKKFKKVTFDKATLSRKNDPNGKEYETSIFPIKVCK